MARIPQVEIERLKSEVSVERLVEGSAVALRRAGKDLLGRCPFHDDAEASLVVTPGNNLWHCFGCQTGGGPIDWVMKTQGVSFRHAVEILREGEPLAAGSPVKRSTRPKLAAPVAFDADDQRLLNQVIGYYHETLRTSPEALGYLKARGIDHPEAIERFRLGYANRTLGLRLPNSQRVTGSAIRERLQRLGILRESGHEHFNGSLVIPIVDEAGQVTEVYGRKIRDDLNKSIPRHLYLPGPHRGVWNVEALAASKEVILCEALIDALSFWCAGYRNVTAAYGVEGFTDDHLAAFKRYGTERVLIAYDRDDAGDRAAEKLAERLSTEGIEVWCIQFPKGMDANAYALKVQPAAKALGLALRKALWLGKGTAPAEPPSSVAVASTQDIELLPAAPEAPIATEALQATARAAAASSLAALAAKEEPRVDEPAVPAAEASPVPSASPLPPAPAMAIEAEVKETEILFAFGDRRYRVRGLPKSPGLEMKVNVLARRGERFYVDTVNLASQRQVVSYATEAARELELKAEVLTADLGRMFLKLELLQDEQLKKALEPKGPIAAAIAEPEREAALAFLRSPQLAERIDQDLSACGHVGETVNKLVAYLAATSRKLDAPLAVLVQSSSAAGKSSLLEAVLAMMPEEERIKYSAVTGQSLFYLGDQDLKHKCLAIVEEEGAARAAYALKLLQSEGELTIASTGKDPETGELKAQTYRVEGPVALLTTSTAAEIDPELQNRCLVLAIDESREQTQAIHRQQRERRTLEGLIARAEREELRTLHRNAQRLLRPLAVLTPYVRSLTFPDSATRTRRDHEKYLTLIDTIALLHQYQREVKTMWRQGKPIEYVEATLEDIALTNELAHEVLGRSLDELPPQTRRLLLAVDVFVAARAREQAIERTQVRFSRRELREHTGIGDTQLKIHLARLVELEYVIAHRKGPATEYELVYDGAGQDGKPFVPGLIDVEALRAAATTPNRSGVNADRSGQNSDRSGSGRPLVGVRSGGGRGEQTARDPHGSGLSEESTALAAKTHIQSGNGAEPSYAQAPVVPVAAATRDDAAP